MTRTVDGEKHREAHEPYQYMERTVLSARKSDVVRLEFFKFHSIRSVIIAKLRMKNNQIITGEYKIVTRNDANFIPITMIKVLLLNTKQSNLNKSIEK